MTSRELREYTSQLTPYQLEQIKALVLRYLILNEELEDTTPECCPFCKDATAIIKKGKPNGKLIFHGHFSFRYGKTQPSLQGLRFAL